jgi:3-deoxy-manno-octulosonate cytidylyltransferase (CMP-KDO synthetase)
MKIIAIIPARYKSTRLKVKPLIQIHNKPLIQVTYEAVLKSMLFDSIFIATDSEKILQVVSNFEGKAILTTNNCRNGTERCAELVKQLNINDEDLIINIQCDEPFIQTIHLKKIINLFRKDIQIATLISSIKKDEIDNESIVKTIKNNNIAVDFSRKKINLDNTRTLYKHIGVYGYRKKTLLKISKLNNTTRELSEGLEQLRWIENNYNISCALIKDNLISINTKNDIKNL